MSESKHTPGPTTKQTHVGCWDKNGTKLCGKYVIHAEGPWMIHANRDGTIRLTVDVDEFERIVACVNGCDGLNPAAYRDVVAALDEYLGMITKVVRRHGGTVHKFIGDGVMAVFGDPVPQPDHALRAVLAARDMQQGIARLRANLQEGQWEPHLRVGVHTGEVVAGDIGSGELLEYTLIGDTVSTASRLEGLNKEYDTLIMISQDAHEAAGPTVTARSLGPAQIRGRGEPLEVLAVDPWV